MQEHNKTTEEKRQLILNAAQKRCAHFGFSKVSMEEIAADIGVSKASLYYYFATKEEIFRAVIVREQRVFIDRMEDSIRRPITATEKIKEYILNQLSFLNELANLRILNMQTLSELRPLIGDLFKNFSQQELRLMTLITEEGKENGEFSIASAQKSAELLVHLLQGLRFRFKKIPEHLSDIKEQNILIESELKLFADVICFGLKNMPLKENQ
jgi:TetR/AcrR family transcriptional regulator